MAESKTHQLERLEWEALESTLAGRRIGRKLVYLASTGSTNDVARRLALAGEPEGAVVLADEQTAGRGRTGKSRWLTPAGTSIAVSVLLRPALLPERLQLLSIMAGLAAAEAVQRAARVACSLKWPNDVMVKDRKLGGVLVESALSGPSVAYAIVGIGLNGNLPAARLGALPDAAARPTTLLDEVGEAVQREDVILALLDSLERLYASLESPGGAAALLARYRLRLQTLRQAVRVTEAASGAKTDGIAEDISPEGALILRLPDGTRRTFAHGEVTVRPATGLPAEEDERDSLS